MDIIQVLIAQVRSNWVIGQDFVLKMAKKWYYYTNTGISSDILEDHTYSGRCPNVKPSKRIWMQFYDLNMFLSKGRCSKWYSNTQNWRKTTRYSFHFIASRLFKQYFDNYAFSTWCSRWLLVLQGLKDFEGYFFMLGPLFLTVASSPTLRCMIFFTMTILMLQIGFDQAVQR